MEIKEISEKLGEIMNEVAEVNRRLQEIALTKEQFDAANSLTSVAFDCVALAIYHLKKD